MSNSKRLMEHQELIERLEDLYQNDYKVCTCIRCGETFNAVEEDDEDLCDWCSWQADKTRDE